jgi:hypothetical protein
VFTTLAAASLSTRGPVDTRPAVGIDENLNDPALSIVLAQLIADGVILEAKPLWYQPRIAADGTSFSSLGSSHGSRVPGFGKTRPDPSRRSTPDEVVIAGAAAGFLPRTSDHLTFSRRTGPDSAAKRSRSGRMPTVV